MKVASRTAALVAVAISIVACSDNTTAPPSAIRKISGIASERQNPLDISNRPDLQATVATEMTFHMRDGTIHKSQFSQKVRAHFNKGLARATVERGASHGSATAGSVRAQFASLQKLPAQFAQFSTTDSAYTPVLAATDGTLADNYQDSQVDSVGNVFVIYGSAPVEGPPITDASGYRNGVLMQTFHANWTAVSGGYVLASQTLAAYYEDGSLAATIVSNVSGTGPTQGDIQPTHNIFPERFKEPLYAALDRIGCWVAPQPAYASTECVWKGLMFGAETFALGVATYYGGPYAEKAAVAAA